MLCAVIGGFPHFGFLSCNFINDKILVKGTTRATKSRHLPPAYLAQL